MSESPAESVTSSLTKKIGPFPGWVYVLIIVVIAYAVYYFRSRSGGTVEPPVPESVSASNGTANPLPVASPPTNETTANGLPGANTNAIWSRNVTNTLVAQGSDPTTVSNAVSKYMSGQPLSAAEKAVINTAITKFGVPPEGVIPVKIAPAPAPAAPKPSTKPAPVPSKPAPKPAPPKATVYTVKPGDSLSAIAQRFYGQASAWMKIYNANKGRIGGNPNLIHPGLVLTIPR